MEHDTIRIDRGTKFVDHVIDPATYDVETLEVRVIF